MTRLIKVKALYDDELEYVLKKEYEGFGIYQRKCPSGYFVHQDYMIANNNIIIQCQSYNNIIIEELLDAIDNYNSDGFFGLKVFMRDNHYYYIHPNGNTFI